MILLPLTLLALIALIILEHVFKMLVAEIVQCVIHHVSLGLRRVLLHLGWQLVVLREGWLLWDPQGTILRWWRLQVLDIVWNLLHEAQELAQK